MIALVAVFALLVQALIPSLAGASPLPPDLAAICTSHGLQTPTGDGPPGPGGHCDNCLCPPVAALSPAPIAGRMARIVMVRSDPPPSRDGLPPRARGPPRPYGQGPPSPNA